MVTVPTASPVATPLLPSALLMVAMPVSLLLQLTAGELVTSRALLSDRYAVAVNDLVNPTGVVSVVGVTTSELMVADVTSTLAESLNELPLASPDAVITTSPTAFPVTIPSLFTTAIVSFELLQVTASCLVTSITWLFVNNASAFKVWVSPTGTRLSFGETLKSDIFTGS